MRRYLLFLVIALLIVAIPVGYHFFGGKNVLLNIFPSKRVLTNDFINADRSCVIPGKVVVNLKLSLSIAQMRQFFEKQHLQPDEPIDTDYQFVAYGRSGADPAGSDPVKKLKPYVDALFEKGMFARCDPIYLVQDIDKIDHNAIAKCYFNETLGLEDIRKGIEEVTSRFEKPGYFQDFYPPAPPFSSVGP